MSLELPPQNYSRDKALKGHSGFDLSTLGNLKNVVAQVSAWKYSSMDPYLSSCS